MNRATTLLECVPNFSVGPDDDILTEIRESFEFAKHVHVLDVHTDASHNRSVFTVIGEPISLLEGTFDAVQTAVERLDLRRHRGQHPRIGVVDVVPFIAIPPTPATIAVHAAREFAESTAYALDLPIFLYDQATLRSPPKALPDVRAEVRNWNMPPDFGPRHRHSTAGAAAVGARDFLVAFNINLDTRETQVAQRIARRIRASNGGHPAIRALGLNVDQRAQVSMNLFDLHAITVRDAYELVAHYAIDEGVNIDSTEIVGLAPRAALAGIEADEIKLPGRTEDYTLETRVTAALGSGFHFGRMLRQQARAI